MKWPLTAILGAVGSTATVLGQVSLPTPGASEFMTFMGCAILVGLAILLYLNIRVTGRKAYDPEEKRRIMPDPLNIRNVDVFITTAEFYKFEQNISASIKECFEELREEVKRLDARVNAVNKEHDRLLGRFDQSQHRNHPNDR